MPAGRKATPKKIEKYRARSQKEERVSAAALEYHLIKAQHNVTAPSYRALAKKHECNKDTLRRRINGTKSIADFNKSKQRLSEPEEEAVVDWIQGLSEQAMPWTSTMIRDEVNEYLIQRDGPDVSPTDLNWASRFLTRHKDVIEKRSSESLESSRARAVNKTAVREWQEMVARVLNGSESGGVPIKPENIHNFDETGFMPSVPAKLSVAVSKFLTGGTSQRPKGRPAAHVVHTGVRENITVVASVSAIGKVHTPLMIYKGKNYSAKLGGHLQAKNPLGMRYVLDLSQYLPITSEKVRSQ